jgi:hypothetical protein
MAYSKARLKSNGNRASPLFQAILNRKCITEMFIYMNFAIGFAKHISISLTSFLGIQNSSITHKQMFIRMKITYVQKCVNRRHIHQVYLHMVQC